MASVPLSLNLRCMARFPVVRFDSQLMAEPNYVRNQYTLPLLVHILACERLRQDVAYFLKQGPYDQKDVVSEFAVSVKHHKDILLEPTMEMFQEGLEDHRSTKANEVFLEGKIPTMGDLVDQMEDSFSGLEIAWENIKDRTNIDFPITKGSIVPTASPRELLIYLLANRPSVLQMIAAEGDTILATY
ncbi:MAG: hypothetical protein M1839_001925 [Geoglossum umbratile]|nr:MAG: hypothetical protein M1839_001925 [Geoglossum umbratile]